MENGPVPVDHEGDTTAGAISGAARRTRKAGTRLSGRVPPKRALVAGLLGAALLGAAGATAATATGSMPGLAEPGPLVVFGLPVARVLLDVAAVATVGLSLLPKLLELDRPAHTEQILSAARRFSVLAALAWLLLALLSLVLQVAELSPGRPVTTGLLLDYVANVPAGAGLLVTTAGALVCAVLGLLAVRYGESVPAEVRFVVAMLSLVPMPLTGHGMDHDVGMIAIELHVLAAAAWTGGLLAVAACVAPRRGQLAIALPRFSRLATLSIVVVGISGAASGILELLATPGVGIDGLFGTMYGRIVIIKMICVLLLAALGSHIRFRLLPRIARHEHTALIGWATVEISVMGLAYGLGAVLARSPVV